MLTQKNPVKFICFLVLCLGVIAAMNSTIVRMSFNIGIMDYNLKRLIEFGALGILGLGLIVSTDMRKSVCGIFGAFPKWIQALLALFFILGVISSFLAFEPKYGFLEVGNYLLLTAAGLFLGAELQDAQNRKTFFLALFLSLILYTLYQLYGLYNVHTLLAQGATLPEKIQRVLVVFPQFTNQRFFAQVFIWLWPVFVFITAKTWDNNKILGILMGILTAYYMSLGLENDSRAIYYSMIIVAVLVSVFHRRGALRWWTFVLPIFILSVVINYLEFDLLLNMGSFATGDVRYKIASQGGRFYLWQFAWDNFITQHPIFGGGPLNYATLPNLGQNAHPHNFIVKTAAEWGVPAMIAIVVTSAWGLIKWAKMSFQCESSNLDLRMCMTAVLFGSAFDAMVSGNLVMPMAQFLAPVMIGIALAYYFQGNKAVSVSKWRHLVCIIVAIASIIFVAQGIYPNVFRFKQTTASAIQMLKNCSGGCAIPPLVWFPQQVSPMMMWVK